MNRRGQTKVAVDCRILDESPKALLIEVTDGPLTRKEWVPLSCVHEINRRDGLIVIDEWLANKMDLS